MFNTFFMGVLMLLFLACEGETSPKVEENVIPSPSLNTVPVILEIDEQKAVKRHNEIRSEVFSNSNLTWSIELAQSAQSYADKMSKSGVWGHDPSNKAYGENLFTASYSVDYVDAIEGWYSEKPYYDYATNKCERGKVCGHYTQIIWEDSVELGCGVSQYEKGQYKGWIVIVCRYNPPGNYIGQRPY